MTNLQATAIASWDEAIAKLGKVKTTIDSTGVGIKIDGYDTFYGDDTPIYLAIDLEGEPALVLYVWADINNEDWTHKIDLSEAHISKRIEENS